MFFDGFSLERVGGLRVRVGGSGPAVLLLHGHPRTHTTWWRVAPLLVSAGFTVVCPDLPGYGESERTPRQTKREIAAALAAMMEALEFSSYAVVGHDRGSPCAHRLAVDHGARKLALMDGIPIVEHLERCDARFASEWWHWFFFAQTAKPAEDWIVRDPLSLVPGRSGEARAGELRRLAPRGDQPGRDPGDGPRVPGRVRGRPASTRPPTARPSASCAARC